MYFSSVQGIGWLAFYIPEPPPVTTTIRSVSGKSPTVILKKKSTKLFEYEREMLRALTL